MRSIRHILSQTGTNIYTNILLEPVTKAKSLKSNTKLLRGEKAMRLNPPFDTTTLRTASVLLGGPSSLPEPSRIIGRAGGFVCQGARTHTEECRVTAVHKLHS